VVFEQAIKATQFLYGCEELRCARDASGLKHLYVSFAQAARAFEHTDWSLSMQQVPLLKGSLACFECRQFKDYDGSDHFILLGLLELVSTLKGVPLTFSQGRYIDPDLQPYNDIL
tara:strand:- start:4692 stop:5036 length:345 start_codon:yes stop_codon:yes gene_type:complete